MKDKINKETVAAVARLACMIAVPLLALLGVETDADTAYNVVMLALSVAVIAWGWWKNAPITEAAKDAQAYLDLLKQIERDDELADELPDTEGEWADPDPADDGSDV